jgi:anti-anti-sigma regulatory factor
MSTSTTIRTHIAYELIDDHEPDVMVIEFLGHEIAGPSQARELREELDALVWPELPHRIVVDFGNVWTFGSAAFGEIVAFARQVGRLVVCNLRGNLRLGAALTDLDLYAAFAPSRQTAIEEARRGPIRGEEETVDYPVWRSEDGWAADRRLGSFANRISESYRIACAARAADNERATVDKPKVAEDQAAARSVAIGAGLTLDDFGGRSDALGG